MIAICNLITELSIGGAQQALAAQLHHGDHNRFRQTVACLYNGDALVARRIRNLGIPVTDLGLTAKWRWDAFPRLYRHLRRVRPTILHYWMFHANLTGRVMGRMCGVPIVITSRRNVNIGGAWRENTLRVTSNLDDRAVAVSEAVRLAEIKHAKKRPTDIITIPNGIDTAPYATVALEQAAAIRLSLGISKDACLVGTVGRLHPQKGYEDLINIVRRICAAISLRCLLLSTCLCSLRTGKAC